MFKKKAKITFVANFQYNCGSSNTLLGYFQTGKKLGLDVRASEFGYTDSIIRSIIPVAKRNWQSDVFVIVYETYPFLSLEDIDQICKQIPRSKRIVIDPDGKYSKPVVSKNDTNHDTPDSHKYWTELYDSLSDTILQPFLGSTTTKHLKSFLYFGIGDTIQEKDPSGKDFDLLYVGNNWYRWRDIRWLTETIAPIRNRLKRVALAGQYWLNGVIQGHEDATYSDPEFLKRNHIEILDPAPYGHLEEAMSRGLLHPILVRPILNDLRFVTPRMFETLAADTIPLIPAYFTHATKLYGDEIKQLTLSDNPAGLIMKILDNYDKYRKLTRDIHETLKRKHSYEARLAELLEFA